MDTYVHEMHLEGVVEHLHDVDDMCRVERRVYESLRGLKKP
jgi:hypothetical protein